MMHKPTYQNQPNHTINNRFKDGQRVETVHGVGVVKGIIMNSKYQDGVIEQYIIQLDNGDEVKCHTDKVMLV